MERQSSAGTYLFVGFTLLVLAWVNRESVGKFIGGPHHTGPRRALPTGPEVEAAKLRAVKRFPELGEKGSDFNRRFVDAVHEAQYSRPSIFDHPEWPLVIAMELRNQSSVR